MGPAANVIKGSLDMSSFCVNAYLGDLNDEDLLVRPAAGANHMAWQLGHLIVSEHQMIDKICPGAMPALPTGFAECYGKETAAVDDASDFHTKAQYVETMNQQRQGTLAALEKMQDADFDKPGPEEFKDYCPTVGAVFALQPTHWMMHSGQWVIVRRMLGKPALF